MLISIAMMFLVGMSMGWICKKIHLPSLFGMIVTGIVLGPYVLDVIDASILNISSDLRRIALIIILMRAGLSLDLNDLKKVGRPAVLMCFVPACFEIGGMVLLAPKLLGISILDAAIMGTVIAAVSPAVIVPKMLKLMEEGYGVKKSIPQMILAGASVDDVFVIVMFTAFTGLAQGDQVSAVDFINIPISIAVGALAGFLIGFLSAEYFKKIHIRDTSKVIILVCVSFLLVTFEDEFASVIPFASLIAVMTMGIALQQKRKNVAKRLSAKFNKLWVGAEVMLFVLVGATVDIRYAVSAGVVSIVLIFAVLVFRMLGVFLCLLKTKLTMKERMFCVIAYMPKATVQAAIGGVPLAMGLSCGNIVLTVAVTAILITAPLGAFLIEATYKKWLGRQTEIKVVQQIYKWYTEEGYGAAKIANMLNEKGYKTKRNCKWSQNATCRILTNEIYTGKIINGKQEVSDFLTGQRRDKDETEWMVVERPELRIIEDETFEKAQEILRGRHDAFNLSHERQSNKHLFSTLIKCKECGWSFRRTVRTYKNTYVRWVCSGRNGRGADSCPNKTVVDEEELIEVLQEYFTNVLKQKKKVIAHVVNEFQRVYKAKDENVEYEKELNAELAKLQKTRQKYMDMYTDDLISREELNEKIGGSRQEMERIENELKMVSYHLTKGEQLENILNNTFKEIEDITDVHQMTNQQLKRLIQKIEVDKEGNVDIYLRLLGDLGLDESVLIEENETALNCDDQT